MGDMSKCKHGDLITQCTKCNPMRTENSPTCPSCGHSLTDNEMHDFETDLWALAPDEGRTEIECPSCGISYHCQGGYTPKYTTSLNEDDL